MEAKDRLVKARNSLTTRHPLSVDDVIDIDIPFLPLGMSFIRAFIQGAVRYDDAVEWMGQWAGYSLMNRWDVLKNETNPESTESRDISHRAYQIGHAFIWGLPNAVVNPHLNPYIGNKVFMKKLHNGEYDESLALKLETAFKNNGYINPKGNSEAKRHGYINLVIKDRIV